MFASKRHPLFFFALIFHSDKDRLMHFSRIIPFFLPLVFFYSVLTAEDLLVCDFQGQSPGINTPWKSFQALSPGIRFSGWFLGEGAEGRREVNNGFGFSVNGPAERESTLADALSRKEYIAFRLQPTKKALNLGEMEVSFSIRRESWHSPRRYAILSNLKGFKTSKVHFTTPYVESGNSQEHHYSFFLPKKYRKITKPVEFRVYAFGANYNHITTLTKFEIKSFSGKVYSLKLSSSQGGVVMTTPDADQIKEGTDVSLRAIPEAGYRFSGWQGSKTSLGNPLVFTMDQNCKIKGNFIPVTLEKMQIGTNLGGIVDWGSHWVFVDIFKRSRDWRTRNESGGQWDSNLAHLIPRDKNGYATQVPFFPTSGQESQIIHTIIFLPEIYGKYTLLFRGKGRLRVRWPGGDQSLQSQRKGLRRFQFEVHESGTFALDIHQTGGADYLRDFRLIAPNFIQKYRKTPFHPLFLESLKNFSCLRFMDWQKTNASPSQLWKDRTTPSSNTQTRAQGASLEYMINLSNRLQQDFWFCLPHAADDNYVRESARLIQEKLDPTLKVYVEYSNETWNTAGPFSQTVYIQDKGEKLGLGADRWQSGQRYTTLRSVEIWKIFLDKFQDDSRLQKVLATQAVNIYLTRMRIKALFDHKINPEMIMPNCLAIAPYFGESYTPRSIEQNGYPSLEELVTTVSQKSIERIRESIQQQKILANEQGWNLVCYEGGQHFVGSQGAENDDRLTEILQAANRDPRMGSRYKEYLNMIQKEGINLFVNFNHIGRFSKWGSWGTLEYQNQPLKEAPKYRAISEWIEANK